MKKIMKSFYYIPELIFATYISFFILFVLKIPYLFMPISATTLFIPNSLCLLLIFLILVIPIFFFMKWTFSDLYDYYHIGNVYHFLLKFLVFLLITSSLNMPYLLFLYAIGLYYHLEDKYV